MKENCNLIIDKIYKAKCVDLNHEGLGVFKIDDFTVFSNNALIGETAKIKINKINSNYALAETVEILESSPDRVTPKCKIFSDCGGCDLMHMNYKSQLEFKKNMALSTLKKIGHLENINFLGIEGASNIYNYRNKVQVPFSTANNKTICGFYKKKTHYIVPLEECFIQPNEATDISKFIKNLCNEYKIDGYSDKNKTGIIRHVLIRKTYDNNYMVILVATTSKVPFINEIVEKIKKRYDFVSSILLNIQEKDTNVVLGDKTITLFGKDEITDEINGYKFKLSSNSFLQVNHEQTEKLYNIVKEFASLKNNEVLLDTYCGVGTIGITLANNAKEVYGIEIVKEAIEKAKENALINGITNCKFFVGSAEEVISDLNVSFDVAVFDPPRKGCDQKFLEAIVNKRIKRIVYVSCDVATLARDLLYLKEYYNIDRVKCVDLFPNSCHVETVVAMSLDSNKHNI